MPFILANVFIDKCIELGLVDDRTRRIVIDAEVGSPVKLYNERFGDERLLGEALIAALVVRDDSEPTV